MDVGDFAESCDEAFRLYGAGVMTNSPRTESVASAGGEEVFRLELAGQWVGKLTGKKVIVEHSDVATGRLGQRSASIELILAGFSESIRVDAELITNRRTGSAAVLGAKYLAAACDTVAIIGTGRIAGSVAQAADQVLKPASITVTSRKEENRDSFVDRHSNLRARLAAVGTISEAVEGADVVVATVPTPEPILSNAMLRPEAHLSVVGGDPRTSQLHLDVLVERTVVVDHPDQAMRSGDFIRYANQLPGVRFADVDGRQGTIGDAALGRVGSLERGGFVTYFTGMAVQDLHAAYTVLVKLGIVM